jgi:hypothetical protein
MNGMNGLYSPKREEVLTSLATARERGTLEWVRPLLEVFKDHPDEAIKQEVRDILGSLKISDAAAVFSDALEDPEFEAIRADVIGFLWSCGFLHEDDLKAVVEAAVEGDFRCVMEALTWVEELESVNDEHALLDAILMVRGMVEGEESASDAHAAADCVPLFRDMLSSLQRLERNQ